MNFKRVFYFWEMNILLVFLYISIPFLPLFGEVDRIASQWLSLSIVNFISLLYIFYNKSEKANFDLALIKKSNLIYIGFLFVSLLSIISSVNQAESFVELFRYLSFFIALISFQTLTKQTNFNLLIVLIVITVGIEISGIMAQYLQGLPMIGFTGNKNIAVVSLALKLNFVYLLIFRSKNIVSKILLSILPLIGVFLIMKIASKLGILLITLTVLGYMVYSLLAIIFNSDFRFLKIAIIITTIFSLNYLIDSNSNINTALNQTVNYELDQGNLDRIKYYGQVFESFKENPILGIGFGNWKIYSIKYDALVMKNYIVQYHAHNDFLQILAETGLFGFSLLLLFFVYFFVEFIKLSFKKPEIVFLFASFMCYFLDMNLNFPSARVIAQLNLIFIISFFYIYKNSNKENGLH